MPLIGAPTQVALVGATAVAARDRRASSGSRVTAAIAAILIVSAVGAVVPASSADALPTTAFPLAAASTTAGPVAGDGYILFQGADGMGRIWSSDTGEIVNLGVAVNAPGSVLQARFDTQVIAFPDTSGVMHVWTPTWGVQNLGFTTPWGLVSEFVAGAGSVVFLAQEDVPHSSLRTGCGGQSLNDDDDCTDIVALRWSAATGTQTFATQDSRLMVVEDDGLFAFEDDVPGTLFDRVVVWDSAADTTKFIVGVDLPAGGRYAVSDGRVALMANLDERNPVASDYTLIVWDWATETVMDSGIPTCCDFDSQVFALDSGYFAFVVDESHAGDLNDDGDIADDVMLVWDPSTASVLEPGRALGPSPWTIAASGTVVAFAVSEFSEGAILNGDGLVDDATILHVWRAGDAQPENLARATSAKVAAGRDSVLFAVREAGDGVSYSGDIDTTDEVLHSWNPATGLVNLGLATTSSVAVGVSDNAEFGGFIVSESATASSDRNGNGTATDQVPMVRDLVSGDVFVVPGTVVATAQTSNRPPPMTGEHFGFFGSESNAGDLTCDGDVADTLMFVTAPGTMPSRPPCGQQAPTITSADHATFTVGVASEFTVTTTGTPVPALTVPVALPDGVSFVDNGDGTASLSGTPAAGSGGVHSLTIIAANGAIPDAVQPFALTVLEAPIAVISSAPSVPEGSTIAVSGSGSSDPDGAIASYAWTASPGATFDSTTAVSPVLTGVDDAAVTVNLTVTDDDGLSHTATTSVVVTNVAPTVNAGPDQTAIAAAAVAITATFTDPGKQDTHTATIDWGDGSVVVQVLDPVTSPFDRTHTYLATGQYTVTVCVTDDDGGQGCDTLTVTITAPNLPKLTIADRSAPEGNTPTTTSLSFAVSLDAPATEEVSVAYSTRDGTAVAGTDFRTADYLPASGILRIPAGTTTATITVTVLGDRLREPNETFYVMLSAPDGAQIADAEARGTILDDRDQCTVEGTSDGEDLTGTNGDDVICAGAGNDRIIATPGADVYLGEAGVDTVDYGLATAAVTVDLGAGAATGWAGHSLQTIENVWGTVHGDLLTGNSGPNVLLGRGGDDVIRASGGGDTLDGGGDSDRISFALRPPDQEGVAASLVGGLSSARVLHGTSWDLADRLIGFEDLYGSPSSDRLDGTDGDNTIWGGLGRDAIVALAGDDHVFGGDEATTSPGQDGGDTIDLGPGDDDAQGQGGADTVYGRDGDDEIAGDLGAGAAGNDTIYGGDGIDTIHGNGGDDTIYGGAGTDTIRGDDGRDSLHGEADADQLYGDSSDDSLWGGPGQDVLAGGDGNDRLWGELDNDELRGDDGDDQLFGGLGEDDLAGDAGQDALYGYTNVKAKGVLQTDGARDTLIGGANPPKKGDFCYEPEGSRTTCEAP